MSDFMNRSFLFLSVMTLLIITAVTCGFITGYVVGKRCFQSNANMAKNINLIVIYLPASCGFIIIEFTYSRCSPIVGLLLLLPEMAI